MPVICRFFGIVIYIYWRDHTPAHFHAKYQDQEVVIEIETGLVKGQLGHRALSLIQEWRALHIEELREDWELARQNKSPRAISPLE